MPPKPKKAGESKKTELKKKEKVIEDKTFGLKNKKGAKQQKFIQQVTQQVKFGQTSGRKLQDLEQQKKVKKEDKKKEQSDLNVLFKPVTAQKISKGADPKSVLCAFFKQGQCTKGDKCKFSHDLTVERKSEKRSLYIDCRDDLEKDTMENWDEAKLEEVVNKKHGEAEQKKPKTEIICKHFLQAIEESKYGWFWECPSGEKCFYRHALPPGFVLKKDKKKEDKKEEISIEDLVEKERASLGQNLTKVTLESFIAWKKKKIKERQERAKADEDKKKADFKAGKAFGLSGREMFTFKPEMAIEDDEEADDSELVYENDEDDDNDQVIINSKELKLEDLALIAQEVDGTGTIAAFDRKPGYEDEFLKLGEAAAISSREITENGFEINEELFNEDDIPVDENLFDGEDLDEVEEGLEELDMNNS